MNCGNTTCGVKDTCKEQCKDYVSVNPPAAAAPVKFTSKPVFHKNGTITYALDGKEFIKQNPTEIPKEVNDQLTAYKQEREAKITANGKKGLLILKANREAQKKAKLEAAQNPAPAQSDAVSPPPAAVPIPQQAPESKLVQDPVPAEVPTIAPAGAETVEENPKLKNLAAKMAKAKLFVVTFFKNEKQHVWVVKAATADAAKDIAKGSMVAGKEVAESAKSIKDVTVYTLDDWVEHVWREWPTRQRIAKGLSKISRMLSWSNLSAHAKKIVRRNFLLKKVNRWAANPPMDYSDIEEEIATDDEVDEGYDGEPSPITNPPFNQAPAMRYNIPEGFYIKQNPSPNEDGQLHCKHCEGRIINTGKLAHNPHGAKVFWLMECEDCGAKYKLTDS